MTNNIIVSIRARIW